jgi:hypothetical protein
MKQAITVTGVRVQPASVQMASRLAACFVAHAPLDIQACALPKCFMTCAVRSKPHHAVLC